MRPAAIRDGDRELVLDHADVARVEARARGMPGLRWSAAFLRARYKYPDIEPLAAIDLAAAALEMDAGALRAQLRGWTRPPLAPAAITIEGRTFEVRADQLEDLDDRLMDGSWIVAALHRNVAALTGAPHEAAIELTGRLLGQSPDSVRGALEWNEQYLRWHDGDR